MQAASASKGSNDAPKWILRHTAILHLRRLVYNSGVVPHHKLLELSQLTIMSVLQQGVKGLDTWPIMSWMMRRKAGNASLR